MAEGTTALDLALTTQGDADGTDLIEYLVGSENPSSSGALVYEKHHDEVASRQLAPPFWGKPNIAALLSSFVREIQVLEDTLWQMLELRTLAGADLPRLKVLGKIVGQPRLGFDTATYRKVIAGRGAANVSKGRGGDILVALNALFGPSQYALTEMGDAIFYVTAFGLVDDQGLAMVTEILPDVRSAGVGLQFLFSESSSIALWGSAIWGEDDWSSTRNL